jgi:serine protease Do
MAKTIETQLQQKGKVTRGWLGVVIQDVNQDLAEQFNLKNAKGILVSEVQPNTPASAAGLKQGDIIIRMNDAALENVADLRNKIAMMAPGSTALLDVIRDGRDKKIQVTIGEQPSNFDKQAKTPTPKNDSDTSLDKYGLSVQELTAELADRFGYQPGSGLIVSDVQDDSSAAMAGLKPGYLVEEVNRVKVHNLGDLKRALKQSTNSNKLLLRVRSGDFSTYVVLGAK